MQFLTQHHLQKMILAACERLVKDKEVINSINVFPVPDQDTGTNLSATFEGISRAVTGKNFSSISEFTRVVQESALLSAQGNSGMIFTSFIAGMLEVFEPMSEIKVVDFTQAIIQGSEKVKNSIEQPMEGTVLDVIEAMKLKSIEYRSNSSMSIDTFLREVLQVAKASLHNTTQRMAVLRDANIVDAGGLGFVVMLESWYEYISGKKIEIDEEHSKSHLKKDTASITANRFEVVCIVENSIMLRAEVLEILSPLGDSIDILEIENKLKFHIHTDKPEMIETIASSLGNLQSLQIVDMKEEKIVKCT